ncbi:MAG: hypothetical protein RQ722_12460 [Desulfuromonadales bacterium]|nr:hypothetical protein [Desulfuromonadales bacterium]
MTSKSVDCHFGAAFNLLAMIVACQGRWDNVIREQAWKLTRLGVPVTVYTLKPGFLSDLVFADEMCDQVFLHVA